MNGHGAPDALQAAITFVARAPIYMSLLSLDKRHLEVSPPFVDDFLIPGGRTRETHLGTFASGANHGTRSRIDETFENLASGQPLVITESEHSQPDGSPVALRSQASYWRDADGHPVGVLIVHQDITAEVQARAALAQSESQLRAVVENIPAELTLLDGDTGRVLMSNSRAVAGISNATHTEVAAAIRDIVANAESAGGSYRFDWTAETGVFARRSYRMKHVVFPDPRGPKRLLWLAEDISELRHIRSEMEAAQEASLAKSQFLATMSHELRTPLNAIIGYAEMLEEELMDREHCAQDASRIRNSAHHLLSMISDILDFSKVESGRVDLNIGQVDIGVLLEDAVRAVIEVARSNNTEINIAIAPEAQQIGADVQRLRQCVVNLLSNAAKFTENGRVDVNVAFEMDGDARLLRIDVVDTGCGISEADAPRLFQPFSQVDGSLTRRRDGAGLGLVTTRRLSELMGGGVSFTSTPGQGSTFTLKVRDHFKAPPQLSAA